MLSRKLEIRYPPQTYELMLSEKGRHKSLRHAQRAPLLREKERDQPSSLTKKFTETKDGKDPGEIRNPNLYTLYYDNNDKRWATHLMPDSSLPLHTQQPPLYIY